MVEEKKVSSEETEQIVVKDAANTKEDTTPQPLEEEQAPAPLKNLTILPPRQKKGCTVDEKPATLLLPPVHREEPVQSIRIALSEVVGYAHITNYRLEVEEKGVNQPPPTPTNGSVSKTTTPKDVSTAASPYTGPNAVVCVPHLLKSLDAGPDAEPTLRALDIYGDLNMIPGGQPIGDNTAFRMVLERYDAASVKEHVTRVRHLLDGNAPTVVSLLDDGTTAAPQGSNTKEGKEKEKEGKEGEKQDKPLPKLPEVADDQVKPDVSNLEDFFYLACGENPNLYRGSTTLGATQGAGSKGKKKKGKALSSNNSNDIQENTDKDASSSGNEGDLSPEEFCKEKIPRYNQLEEEVRVPCSIRYGGFHPPPPSRRMMGDLAYLEVTPPPSPSDKMSAPSIIHITACSTGFYVSRTAYQGGRHVFDPSPARESCFSHSLLDCILQASPAAAAAWKSALDAATERAEILNILNRGNFSSFFRLAIRGDFPGFSTPSMAASAALSLDATMATPSWLVPLPSRQFGREALWNRNALHAYHAVRAEEDVSQTFGVDVRNGGLRDWNEELQIAREMPSETQLQRVDRARAIHKTMTEFGEASLLAVQAIAEGQIVPMNPNEGTRSQVYLHNNIFVSRAVDCGPETFRMVKGDRAAKKMANREIQCIKTFHRMEQCEFCTLATVLIDYLGMRFVCQSILPGILNGDKSHTILLGSVDTDKAMKFDPDFHKLIQDKVGEALNLAARPLYRNPLTEERREECRKMKKALPLPELFEKQAATEEREEPDSVIHTCAPIETKGIKGSDQRRYMLDFGRLTPRDANWVPRELGGTGNWETMHEAGTNGSSSKAEIPSSLNDDEWTTSVLRPELMNRWFRIELAKYLEKKRVATVQKAKAKEEAEAKDKADGDESKTKADDAAKDAGAENKSTTEESKGKGHDEITEEEKNAVMDGLRLSVNVFIPDIRVVDEKQNEEDKNRAREAAAFLWDEVLPRITRTVKDSNAAQLPMDGRGLTEYLHRHGVNCRYLGRLAMLAKEQEEKDAQITKDLLKGRMTQYEQKTMPLCWLEILECEIVARAAKHVLDAYLTENSGVAGARPLQTIATFLSALVSEREETAAQSENRMERSSSPPDEEDMHALTICDTGGDGDAIPPPPRSRYGIWQDIEREIARRFRHILTLFNRGNKAGRALHIPLLRRVCQRSGLRLVAKKYEVGATCYTGGNAYGGRLTESYPVSPLDIVEVVPMMKHTAAYHEGFTPCSLGPAIMTPQLQVSLVDARLVIERVHIQMSAGALPKALELAQEAASLYQRVTEQGAHPGVVECMDLMANIFLEAGNPVHAAEHCAKALGLAVQCSGFDGHNVFNIHMALFQMLYAAREFDGSVKHLRSAMYLLELFSGPHHPELASSYHKLGAIYSYEDYKGRYSSTALKFFRVVQQQASCDRLMECFTTRTFAKSLAEAGEYKEAVDAEKRANKSLARFLGKDNQWVKESDKVLIAYTKLAVEQGSRLAEDHKLKEKAEKADAVAADLVAEEEGDKKKKNSKKKKKNNKK